MHSVTLNCFSLCLAEKEDEFHAKYHLSVMFDVVFFFQEYLLVIIQLQNYTTSSQMSVMVHCLVSAYDCEVA